MTSLPTRQQVERAGDLDFASPPRTERQANITIEIAPDGLHIRCEYSGSLSSIPAAVEQLRAAGILDLARSTKAAPAAPAAPAAAKKSAGKVRPEYNADGDACCPKHGKVLREGQYGLYCPAKDDSTERGYCSLRFAE